MILLILLRLTSIILLLVIEFEAIEQIKKWSFSRGIYVKISSHFFMTFFNTILFFQHEWHFIL